MSSLGTLDDWAESLTSEDKNIIMQLTFVKRGLFSFLDKEVSINCTPETFTSRVRLGLSRGLLLKGIKTHRVVTTSSKAKMIKRMAGKMKASDKEVNYRKYFEFDIEDY